MAVRVIAFVCGALFGAFGVMIDFWWQESEMHWGIVGLAALVLGILAALFGRKFWETAISHWP